LGRQGQSGKESPQVVAPSHRTNDLSPGSYVEEEILTSFLEISCSTHLEDVARN
jgi:hypothetical protein